jgi:3-isopropylmalate/(R)-2-methylmalate dehydratase small subunit
VISTSFADIFRNNALKNGLLPVIVEPEIHQELLAHLLAHPSEEVEIDLERQTLSYAGDRQANFPIDAFNKTCLLEGIDQLGYLLKFSGQIETFEQTQGAAA